MSTIQIATSEADATAAEAVEQHHAQMAGALAAHVARLTDAAAAGDASAADRAHAMPEGRLLVASMIDEHHVITGLVDAIARADDPVRTAASATALRVMFDSHLAKENELVLPLLTGAARPDRAAHPRPVHRQLPRARPGGVAPAVRPGGLTPFT